MDTTAHTLAFVIYSLAMFPEVQRQAQEAVDKSPLGCDISHFPVYLDALLKESMRKYPTAAGGSFRQVQHTEGYRLTKDVFLPHGSWVAIHYFCIHNSPEVWGADVDEFKPERWLPKISDSSVSSAATCADLVVDPLQENSTANTQVLSGGNPLSSPAVYGGGGLSADELSFAPFAYGMRNCVGMNLAMMELKAAMLELISRFHFELADETMRNERQALISRFTTQPADGLPVRIVRRSKS